MTDKARAVIGLTTLAAGVCLWWLIERKRDWLP